ncbi:Phage integrase, N-terminal SAM-like domain [Pasteurella testudinis DSM 23072]|uniref:Phage integrase, N-terminal SAM-like domain n=1 Tax=Pasteurella testudinis DSM 23072 TaxID=1122938 RepID=A0A1W1V1U4_9PAST|nr:integrase arm-type DNA-binding domain-containing protein [Pasteurella testudinis]SMB87292.1 Phage integrase, N-terminal SAM-like domain [Pasteurella testudinis DSM 23072]SUB51579.1 prophage integrase [Pasteurella testudinis]
MARIVKRLTNTQVDKAKPLEKPYHLADGGGLYLLVKPNGVKTWQFNYYKPITKNRTYISLNNYPDLSLAQARSKREEFKALLAQNIDPQLHQQQEIERQQQADNNTFAKIAAAWFEERRTRAHFSAKTAADTWSMIERHILPHFGELPITQITALMAINAFKPLQIRGTLETLKRAIQKMNEIMTYALHRGIIENNPIANIGKEFDSPTVTHMKAIKPEQLGEFLTALANANLTLTTRLLIQWQLLTMTRPAEAATARYSDINEKERIWTIYIQKGLKTTDEGREHKVTLSKQAIAVLREIKKISGGKTYLFPSIKNPATHINTQTANAAIKRIGYQGKLVAHGMRAIASTVLNEARTPDGLRRFDKDLIEVALSHINNDDVRMAYLRAEYLPHRFDMLQWWGDYVEQSAQNVIPKFHLQVVNA